MNEQRFFDESLTHIRQQGKPSVNFLNEGLNVCMYDGPDGLGCAFRPAIMTFDSEMEGESADEYPKENLHEWARDLPSSLVTEVQSAHDCSCRLKGKAFVEAFERKMRQVASDFNRDNADNILVEELIYREAA